MVWAADERFLPHAATSMLSFLETNREIVGRIFLVGDVGKSRRWRLFQRTVAFRFGKQIEVIAPPSAETQALFTSRGISAASYYRLFLGSLLPPEVHHVLYLDADTLVVGPLCELGDLVADSGAFHSYPLCAVESQGRMRHFSEFESTNFFYFNAGVLLINLKKWRETLPVVKLVGLAKKHGSSLRFHDQDVLNLATLGNFGSLEPKFNRMRGAARAGEDRIIHFVGPAKPWTARGRKHSYTSRYRKLRRRTPYLFYVWPDAFSTVASSLARLLGRVSVDRIGKQKVCKPDQTI